MKRLSTETKLTIQVIISIVLIAAGLTLLFLGFYADPHGEIHDSVLIGYGEVSSFAGALLGIDYSYKFKMHKIDLEDRKRYNHFIEKDKEEELNDRDI